MEHKKVVKFLEIKGLLYIILSIIELVLLIIMNFVEFNIDTDPIFLHEFIYSADIIPLSGTFLWLFVIISVVFYLFLGLFLNRKVTKENIESEALAKFIIVMGMILLIGGFVKMNYLVLLGKTKISTISGSIRLQAALYDFDVTEFYPAVFWVLFISVNTYIIISGLVVTAVGIKYTLLLEQEKTLKEKSIRK